MAKKKRVTATEAQLRIALRREQLARNRFDKWSSEYRRLLDRADSRKSKSWRSRDLKSAQAAARHADKAEKDYFAWSDRAAKLQELERRRKKRKKKKAQGYEYVLKVQYRSKAKGSAVWWDVRLRREDLKQASKQEVGAAVRAIRRGEIPDGWEVMGIAWDTGVRPSWQMEPAREPDSSSQGDAALASLSATLGRVEGEDFVVKGFEVGEEYLDGEENEPD